ncbi:MAG TPA: hypothetical protein VK822_16600 [Acetobacteraceae bacterium]|nr:hypothetical protein [Acetobacteraceae bacterium]
MSAQAVVVTLFGGVAAIWGPVIGAAVLVPLAESLNVELGGIQSVVYGVAIIVIMQASPDGLFWTIRDRFLTPKAPSSLPAFLAANAPPVTHPGTPAQAADSDGSVEIVRRPACRQRGYFRG